MSVSRSLRYQVLRRDNHTCRYCGRSAPEVKLAVDHVTPTALGGSDEASNLVTACVECNGGKAATPPDAAVVEDVNALALRWSGAVKTASAQLGQKRARRDAVRQDFLDAWNTWTYEASDGTRRTLDLPNSWPNSIDQISAAGLGTVEMLDAVDVAMRTEKVKDTFRYFCGVCWRRVADLHETARQILDSEEAEEAAHSGDQEFLDSMLDLAWSTATDAAERQGLADLGVLLADQLRDYMPSVPDYTIGLVTAHAALVIWKLARDEPDEALTAIRAATGLALAAGDLTQPEGAS